MEPSHGGADELLSKMLDTGTDGVDTPWTVMTIKAPAALKI